MGSGRPAARRYPGPGGTHLARLRTHPLELAAAWSLGLVFLIVGLVGIGWAGVSGLRHLSAWGWDQETCTVVDVHVEDQEPFLEQIYTSGSYVVLFDLAVAGTDEVFTDMPAAPSRPTYHDQYEVQQEILPATPGARLDCWVDPDGSGAYIRLAPKWFIVFHLGGGLFAGVFVLGGVMMLGRRSVES